MYPILFRPYWQCYQLDSIDVREFIQCRRFETLTLHHILQGFSTSACDWLMPPGESARRQSRVPVSDALKRRELLEEFIFWYFDSFVSNLIKVSLHLFFSIRSTSRSTSDQLLYHRNTSISESGPIFPSWRLGNHVCPITRAAVLQLFPENDWCMCSKPFNPNTLELTIVIDRSQRSFATAQVRILLCAPFTQGDWCPSYCQSCPSKRYTES